MAKNTSKNKKKNHHLSSHEKQETPSPKPWPNLPQPLISLIARQPNLMQNITSFGCVTTKSWRSPPRQCTATATSSRSPQLVEIHQADHVRGPHNNFISFHEKYPYEYYHRRTKYKDWWHNGTYYFKGFSHGQLVVLDADTSFCSLKEPPYNCSYFLPDWDPNHVFKLCTLDSSPEDLNGCNVMVLTGNSYPAFAFCRWGRKSSEWAWTIENCYIKEPYAPSQDMRFSNAIGFEGRFYALSLQGSVVMIEKVDSCFGITAIGTSRAVPSKVSRQFREYLVESDGEILLVFLISRKSIDVVEDVEVFKLDIDKLLWVKLEGLGDRTLFLEDECCMWVEASKVGCKRNCIYFTHHRVDEWLIFDMESENISPAFGSNAEIQEFVLWGE